MFNCKAQTFNLGTPPENVPLDNYYLKDLENSLDNIVGVWKWVNGNSYFEITLQEFEHYNYPSTTNQYWDAIFGKYKYVENGNVIAEVNDISSFPNFKLTLIFVTPNLYKVIIEDIVSNKGKIGEFTLTSSNTATLELWESGGVRVGDNISLLPFSLPTSVVLTKQ